MTNSYMMIVVLFVAGGLATSAWGWHVLAGARARGRWPRVEGRIESARQTSEHDDLLPEIRFSYAVNDQRYQRQFEFPPGTMPTPELTSHYLKKYPVGARVSVFYDPDQPATATLEPGARGDWLILALGLLATLVGVAMLVI